MHTCHIQCVSTGTTLVLLLSGASVFAQVTLDGTLGRSEALPGPEYRITDDLGRQLGANLFHSFGQFSIPTGHRATFSGPASISHIIGRVTGGEISRIDGILHSTIPGANLYLLNPAGIFFGENARLDVQGSFHASTADYLRLGQEGRFDARTPESSVLSVAPPSAFGFLGGKPASITVQGSYLEVPVGKAFSLIGGDIEIRGGFEFSLIPEGINLSAPSGLISLASVASAGELILDSQTPGLSVNSFATLGSIRLLENASITTKGDPGGSVVIRTGQLVIENGFIDSPTTGNLDHPGLGIDVEAREAISLTHFATITSSSGLYNSPSIAEGDAGDIRIKTGRLELKGDPALKVYSVIASRAFSEGDGGDITITAESVNLSDNSLIEAHVLGSGSGGDITIKTHDLKIQAEQGTAYISASTFDRGKAGNIDIAADEVLLRGGSPGFTGLSTQATRAARGSANGGDIRLTAKSLQVLDGAQISASVSSGAGNAGSIEISADSVLIHGFPAGIFSSSQFVENSQEPTRGKAGDIRITAQELRLTDRARISSFSTSSGSAGNISLSSDTLELREGALISSSGFFGLGTADSGNIDIATKSLLISGLSSAEDPFNADATAIFSGAKQGRGGDIRINATDDLTLTSRGSISSSSFGSGRGGNVEITTRQLQVLDGSNVLASAFGSGDGGAIRVTADEITIAGVHPEPFKDVTGATSLSAPAIASQTGLNGGAAGEIQITSKHLELLDGGGISSETFGVGRGGKIDITADSLLASGVSTVFQKFLVEQGLDTAKAYNRAASGIRVGSQGISLSDRKAGNAGTIALRADNLRLQNGGLLSSQTAGSGVGGDIAITAKQITLANDALITAESTGKGNAGAINIIAGDFHSRQSSITTASSQAAGGNIQIDARSIQLMGTPVTASVTEGVGGGGNVTLTAPSIVALDNSDITAQAKQGFGGNITINADVFFRDSDVRLDASSQVFGNDGTVEINAPDLDLSAALVTLPASYLNAAAQLSQRCAAVAADTRSSFVVRGRGVLPPGPDEALPARMAGCLPDEVTEPASKVPLALTSDTPTLTGDRWENSR